MPEFNGGHVTTLIIGELGWRTVRSTQEITSMSEPTGVNGFLQGNATTVLCIKTGKQTLKRATKKVHSFFFRKVTSSSVRLYFKFQNSTPRLLRKTFQSNQRKNNLETSTTKSFKHIPRRIFSKLFFQSLVLL